jgi:hypothetical protein
LHNHGDIFLDWLRNLLPALRSRIGNFYGALQMNDDETDAGGDFFIDFIKVIIAIFFFVLFITVIGIVIWGLII